MPSLLRRPRAKPRVVISDCHVGVEYPSSSLLSLLSPPRIPTSNCAALELLPSSLSTRLGTDTLVTAASHMSHHNRLTRFHRAPCLGSSH